MYNRLNVTPCRGSKTESVSIGQVASAEDVVVNVMHNRNTDARVNILDKLTSRIERCLVVVLDCKARLHSRRQTLEVTTEVVDSHGLVVVVSTDMNVELVVRCARQAKHVEDLAMNL